jgi:hypothetical protein
MNFKFSRINKYFKIPSQLNNINYQNNEILAYNILKEYMPKKYFIKTSFSINYSTILHMLNDIIVYKPLNILEFGSGLSTIVLSKAISDLNLNTIIHTIDSDIDWLNNVNEFIEDKSKVNFHFCPISESNSSVYQKYYNINENLYLNSIQSFDMYIIDGPWSRICKNIRYGAVDYILSKNNNIENMIIYVDDINRKDELYIYESLKKSIHLDGCKYFKYGRISKMNKVETKPFR